MKLACLLRVTVFLVLVITKSPLYQDGVQFHNCSSAGALELQQEFWRIVSQYEEEKRQWEQQLSQQSSEKSKPIIGPARLPPKAKRVLLPGCNAGIIAKTTQAISAVITLESAPQDAVEAEKFLGRQHLAVEVP